MMAKTRIASIEEVRSLPVGSVVYLKKDGYWLTGKYRICEKHGCKYLEGVHNHRMLGITEKKLFHYEIEA